jgi:hypothetical protein
MKEIPIIVPLSCQDTFQQALSYQCISELNEPVLRVSLTWQE